MVAVDELKMSETPSPEEKDKFWNRAVRRWRTIRTEVGLLVDDLVSHSILRIRSLYSGLRRILSGS